MARTALVPRLPREAWILLGGDALSAVGSGLTLPFFLVYLNRVRGIDLGLAGLALSTIALAGLLGNPVGGSLSDRVGARRTLVFGLLVATAGALSVAFVHQVWQAFAAAGLVGFGAAVIWPAQDSLLATLVRPEQRSSVFAVRHATLNAGFGIGGVAAALLVDFSSPFSFELLYVLDALSFLAFVPVVLTLPAVGLALPDDERAEAEEEGYGRVLRDKAFRGLWVLMAVLVVAGYAQYHAAFPAFATGAGGLTAGALGIVFAANTFAVAGFQLFVLRLLAGCRRSRSVALACAAWSAAWFVTLLAGGLGGGSVGVAVFASAAVLLALGETLIAPAMPALVNDIAPERLRGRYNGAFTLAWTSGFVVGPLIAGPTLAAGFGRALFVGLIAVCAIAAFGALRLERRLPAEANVVLPAVA